MIGAFDWANYTVTASVHLPTPATAAHAGAGGVLGWVGAHLGGDPECDGPSPICSNPWRLYAVLDNNPGGVGAGAGAGAGASWQLRLHLRAKDIGTPATALFNATVAPGRVDAKGGWARVGLTIEGTAASVTVDGRLVADRV